MSASDYNEVKQMVERGINQGYSHVIIVCDTFDYEDYPVYVKNSDDIYSYIDKYNKNMNKIMEIYNYDMDIESQLKENRAYHIKSNRIVKEKKKEIQEYNKLKTKSELALEFATKKHEGQFRKGKNKRPYITHPINVASLIKKYKGDSHELDSLIAAAYLHDTLEDTNTTFNELAKTFGIQVASLVKELTSDKEFKDELGKKKYLALKMRNMTDWALDIKLCDRLDNISDLDDVDDEFRKKYIEETIYIINYIVKNRKITKTQTIIIKDIMGTIYIMISNLYKEEIDKEQFKFLLTIEKGDNAYGK